MVLSNKKLKQKLRADKVEFIVASEAQNNSTGKNPLRTILSPGIQKPKLSKREKRRQTVKENPGIIQKREISGDAEAKKQNGPKSDAEKVKKDEEKKRKRDENDASEDMKEEKKPKQMKKKKKKKKKKYKKSKKKVENEKVNEEGVEQSGNGATGEQLVPMTIESTERENIEVPDKVYVGGIPFYSTEDDIRSFFESCGTITDLDCMTFPDTGKFRGIAIITFKTEAAAKRALALDGSDMGGLFLKIQPFKSSKVNKLFNFSTFVVEGYNRIYVGNLSWDVTEADLRNLFTNCTIESVRFGEDKETGEFKGYAHVDFGDTNSLNMALKLDQKIVCGRPVRISCAVVKKGAVTNVKLVPKDYEVQSNANVASAVNEIQVTSSREVNAVVSSEVNFSSEADNPVSAKIRRRTCYECGERGHISSLCPKIKADDSANQALELDAVPKKGYAHLDFGDYSTLKLDAVPKKGAVANFKSAPKDYLVQSSYNFSTVNEIQNSEANPVSSSIIRRRTCYECGERGHISSLCPKIKADDWTNKEKETDAVPKYNRVQSSYNFNEVDENQVNASSEANPKIKADNSTKKEKETDAVPKYNRLQSSYYNTAVDENQVNASSEVSSSKIRRRTCYECGERGHLSSLCPKIKADDSTNKEKETDAMPKDNRVQSSYNFTAVDEIPVTASSEANPVSSSKIRRRTCYECGERGHISSLCPKIKAGNSTNPGAAA